MIKFKKTVKVKQVGETKDKQAICEIINVFEIKGMGMKYRKKAVTVDAIQVELGYKNLSEIIAFVGQESICPIERRMDYELKIKTAEGIMTAKPGYWIIKAPDPKGGFRCWAVDPEYFAENYEKI